MTYNFNDAWAAGAKNVPLRPISRQFIPEISSLPQKIFSNCGDGLARRQRGEELSATELDALAFVSASANSSAL